MAALLVLYRLGETVQMVHSKGYIARLVLSQEKGTKWRFTEGGAILMVGYLGW